MTPSWPPDEGSGGGWSDPGPPERTERPPTPSPERYRVGPLIGRGGMGVVRVARDTALGRDVALKELDPERVDDPVAQARLAREAAITSRLDHPGIVTVHDAGRLPDGGMYYTMRLVRGMSLERRLQEYPDTRGLVRHLLSATEAVAAAHDAGIVHRDLKPANILVGPHGETQVVDWGLAAPTLEAASRWADLPEAPIHGPVGTPSFMSPEQARGEDPHPRHDVWSLGHTLARLAGASPGPELQAIIDHATALEGRYPDAGAFADDLLRWFEGRRVAAYTYSPAELLRRLWTAWRLPLTITAVALVGITTAITVGWWTATLARDRARLAEREASDALASLQLEQAVDAATAGDRQTAERLAMAVLQRRDDPLARGVLAAFGRSERPTRVREEPGPECAWSALPDGAGWVLCGDDGTVSRWERGERRWTVPAEGWGGEVQGDTALIYGATGGLVALDVATGAERGRWAMPYTDWSIITAPRRIWTANGPYEPVGVPPSDHLGRLQVGAASPDGRLALLAEDGTLLLGTLEAPGTLRVQTAAHGDHIATALRWTADGDLVVGTLRGRVLWLSGETGEERSSGESDLGNLSVVRPSPDGVHVALQGSSGGVGLWRLDTASLVAEVPAERPRAVAFATDGLVVHDGSLRTWSIPAGAPAVIRAEAGLADAVPSSDGARLATVGGGGWAAEIDLRDGRTRRLPFGERVVKTAAHGPRGLLVTGMDPPFLALDTPDGWRALPSARRLRRLVAFADGSVLGVDLHQGLYRWPGLDAEPEILALDRTFVDLERDGEAAVVLDVEGRVERVDGTTVTPLGTFRDAGAVALRGPLLAVTQPHGVILRHDEAERRLDAGEERVLDVALSRDGRRVAAGTLSGRVLVWDRDGTRIGVLPGHRERAVAVEFLPDGDLVSASWDRTARVWDLDALVAPLPALARTIDEAWGP